jgi:hypothetical protein
MQFAIGVTVLECSFVKHSHGPLEVKVAHSLCSCNMSLEIHAIWSFSLLNRLNYCGLILNCRCKKNKNRWLYQLVDFLQYVGSFTNCILTGVWSSLNAMPKSPYTIYHNIWSTVFSNGLINFNHPQILYLKGWKLDERWIWSGWKHVKTYEKFVKMDDDLSNGWEIDPHNIHEAIACMNS